VEIFFASAQPLEFFCRDEKSFLDVEKFPENSIPGEVSHPVFPDADWLQIAAPLVQRYRRANTHLCMMLSYILKTSWFKGKAHGRKRSEQKRSPDGN
jgi:hypothetical protein